MTILRFVRPVLRLKRPNGLLRLAVAATALTLAGVVGTTHAAHADGPVAAGVATTATGAEGIAVPNANTVILSLDGVKLWSTTCVARAAVSYNGIYPLSNYKVEFEVVSGQNAGLKQVAYSNQNGDAVVSLPRPTSGSQPNVIRATLSSYQPFVSNTVNCQSLVSVATAAVTTCTPILNLNLVSC